MEEKRSILDRLEKYIREKGEKTKASRLIKINKALAYFGTTLPKISRADNPLSAELRLNLKALFDVKDSQFFKNTKANIAQRTQKYKEIYKTLAKIVSKFDKKTLKEFLEQIIKDAQLPKETGKHKEAAKMRYIRNIKSILMHKIFEEKYDADKNTHDPDLNYLKSDLREKVVRFILSDQEADSEMALSQLNAVDEVVKAISERSKESIIAEQAVAKAKERQGTRQKTLIRNKSEIKGHLEHKGERKVTFRERLESIVENKPISPIYKKPEALKGIQKEQGKLKHTAQPLIHRSVYQIDDEYPATDAERKERGQNLKKGK